MHGAEGGHPDINYKVKYKALKRKLKFLVFEQECFMEELRKAQRKLLKVSRDKSFLLDRLLQYEAVEDSTSDSDATGSSDSDGEGNKDGSSSKKRKLLMTPQLPSFGDSTSLLSGLGFPGFHPPQGQQISPDQPRKKMAKTKKTIIKKVSLQKAKSADDQGFLQVTKRPTQVQPQISRAEIERQLDSKPRSQFMGIEKAPLSLPMDLFSSENSNQEGEHKLAENLMIDVHE